MALAASRPALALDPGRAVSQYLVDHWGVERGYVGGAVHGITQSADGHLWIASEKGLVRFDGLTFTLFVPPPGPAGTGSAVLGVAADGQGGVWGRQRGPMLVRHHDLALTRLEWLGNEYTVVTAMLRGRDDSMLLTPLGRGVLQYRQGHVSTRVAPTHMPNSFVIALCETSDGTLWLGTRDAGLLQVQGGQVRSVIDGLPDRKINALQAGPDGALWVATDRGVARWTRHGIVRASLPAFQDASATAMVRDRDGHLWIAFGALGVVRVSADGATSMVPRDARSRGDVTAMFEDRDGNLWLGTSRGIERLRDGAFSTFAGGQGLPDDGVGPVFADEAGRVWMGPPAGGLYWLERGVVHRLRDAGLDQDVVYSLSGSGNDLWVGRRRGGLTHVRLDGARVSIERLTAADGLAQDSVFAVQQTRDGSVWAGTLSAGVSRYQAGRFTTYGVADGLASQTVTAILEATDGSLWFGTPAGVSIRSRDGWRTLDASGGLPASEVTALLQDSSGAIWVGTSAGLACVQQGRVRRVIQTPPLAGAIAGLGEDRRGRLWVTTAERVVSADLAHLRSASGADVLVREYGPGDGLVRTEGVKRHRSVVTDRFGSTWLSLASGLSRVDTSRREPDRVPITAMVDAVAGDDLSLRIDDVVRVPAGTRRITIALAGAGLTTPERVRFRYRLDGFDSGWTSASARQAGYTNLPPGHYVFRLMASDIDGAWPGREARLHLRVAAAFWQTVWFQGAVGLALVGSAWGAYRLRLRQVARRLAHTFEARLAERTRIAQDLHDTLLQGCLSASMQLHVAVDQLPEDAPTRPALERIQQLMTRVIDEGRVAVRGLRVGMAGSEALDQALARAPEELAPDHPAGFRVVVDGQPRDLHPMIRDEVYRIGREAIANALRHADARHIEVELAYTPAHLRLSVRDDGRGIDGEVLRDGRENHWGLEGMRERAHAMRATLRVSSRADAGTEVELLVPGGIAFATDQDIRS